MAFSTFNLRTPDTSLGDNYSEFFNKSRTITVYHENFGDCFNIIKARKFIQNFLNGNNVSIKSSGFGNDNLIINGKIHELTPYGITIKMMIDFCSGDIENFRLNTYELNEEQPGTISMSNERKSGAASFDSNPIHNAFESFTNRSPLPENNNSTNAKDLLLNFFNFFRCENFNLALFFNYLIEIYYGFTQSKQVTGQFFNFDHRR